MTYFFYAAFYVVDCSSRYSVWFFVLELKKETIRRFDVTLCFWWKLWKLYLRTWQVTKKLYILCILLIEIFSKRSRESLYVIIVKGQAFEDLHNRNICVLGFQTEIKSRGKDPQLSKMKSLSILVVLTSLGGLCLSLPGAPTGREMDRKKPRDNSPKRS